MRTAEQGDVGREVGEVPALFVERHERVGQPNSCRLEIRFKQRLLAAIEDPDVALAWAKRAVSQSTSPLREERTQVGLLEVLGAGLAPGLLSLAVG